TYTLIESADGIGGDLEYNSGLLDRTSIERMIGHFQILLEGIVAAPGQRVENLPLLGHAERETILVHWNKTQTHYPRNSSIPEIFEEQVEHSPESVALIFGQEKLTYRELNERANQLAHHLQKKGVGPDVRVGLCLERSLEMIIGLLGILKAGGAYVPLDAHYPSERLAYMFEDTAAPILITEKKFKHLAPKKMELICLDENENQELFSQESRANPISQVTAENLAYVIYTSGSTGQPKGVSIPHRAVARLVKKTHFMTFGPEAVFLQFAPISFDASTLEIWGPLLNGAKLVIFPPGLPSLESLSETLQREQITTLWLTAGLFHQMVEHHLDALKNIRQLLAGGDVLSVSHVAQALRGLPGCQLINGYGPTENTTFTCCYSIPKTWAGDRSVPIGTPISNTQVYILDKHLAPVPIGVAGELFIGCDGLARDYLNSPALTAQKFIPNPFSSELNAKLYKTGDFVRFLADGNIEFLGRLDQQVKIRGFRIELGEIETILAQHAELQESLVIVRESSTGKQLIAYVVPKKDAKVTRAELRKFLETKLPDYMMPSHFVWLEKLPLTVNGKVDRRQLPPPEEIFDPNNYVAPRTPDEENLARIWSEVLGIKPIGIHDNFFELGGHSLLATQIISRVSHAFATDLPLRVLFELPTIAALAEAIRQHKNKIKTDPPPILRRSRGHRSDPEKNVAQKVFQF
ncbi:MAG: amino acid adenylation domain-containing protein, partial [Verrucomicrobiota bacterium]|nr:amino acid adenylation domain-containing protein [Verrucomicrobiota bacterium]